jgi:hypothetical protein
MIFILLFEMNHNIRQFSVRSALAWILMAMQPLGQLFLRTVPEENSRVTTRNAQ